MNACPECDGPRLILGTTTTDKPAFRPKGIRFFSFRLSDLKPKQGNRFVACLDCGLLWSAIDKVELTSLLARKGRRKIKQELKIGEENLG